MIPETMKAMVTMGHGDFDMLVWHEDWPVPTAASGEVLIRVGACGLNNTDINTRTGWYSKAVSEATTGGAYDEVGSDDPSWGGAAVTFPRIQGADICGEIVAVGAEVAPARIGERVITDNWLRDPADPLDKERTGYYGSEHDGGFAEYATIPATNALAVDSPLSDAELATFSCSYSTAEGMLTRAAVTAGDTVLVPGASGGVGGAVVQLAKLRGARVIAMASAAKHGDVATLGADVVGGAIWPALINVLTRGGRYTCSGAIAGPMVNFDLRTFYLHDLTFTGSTVIDQEVMPRLIGYVEAGKVKPVLAATYALTELHDAQRAFIAKAHTGNIVGCP